MLVLSIFHFKLAYSFGGVLLTNQLQLQYKYHISFADFTINVAYRSVGTMRGGGGREVK